MKNAHKQLAWLESDAQSRASHLVSLRRNNAPAVEIAQNEAGLSFITQQRLTLSNYIRENPNASAEDMERLGILVGAERCAKIGWLYRQVASFHA